MNTQQCPKWQLPMWLTGFTEVETIRLRWLRQMPGCHMEAGVRAAEPIWSLVFREAVAEALAVARVCPVPSGEGSSCRQAGRQDRSHVVQGSEQIEVPVKRRKRGLEAAAPKSRQQGRQYTERKQAVNWRAELAPHTPSWVASLGKLFWRFEPPALGV